MRSVPWVAALLPLALVACQDDHRPATPHHVTAGAGGSGGSGPDPLCDRDGDEHAAPSCGGDDCSDRNPGAHPGATERCSGGVDEDCDGLIDEDCACAPGDLRRCFPGGDDDPARDVGACVDGAQVCAADGHGWGPCVGAVEPLPEGDACDGLDQDCNGIPDDGTSNACGACGEVPPEFCGNGLDDDCDGQVDPQATCNLTCEGVDVDAPEPPGMACCFQDPDVPGFSPRPVPFSTLCVETPLLPACISAERLCIDLDGDPRTRCAKRCVVENGVTRCVCGAENGDGEPGPTEGCGFETPCAWLGCEGRVSQPCYTGNPLTLGRGICHGGRTSCEGGAWGACEGEQLPGPEVCGDGVDNDCDGLLDEEDGLAGPRCKPACRANATELCKDGQDNDCDGFVDEGCLASRNRQDCYAGPPDTRGVGICTDGEQVREGEFWGPCMGSIGPSPERCGDGIDADCDGFGEVGTEEDASCCLAAGPEVCNGRDDDCDGLTDEGVASACGSCDDDPCYVERIREPASCLEGNGRICDRIIPEENNPDAFTISTDKRGGGKTNVIYVAVDLRDQVAKLDTVSGQKIWQVHTEGDSPSRTAVPIDNSVWVANRGFNGPSNPLFSNTVHLDRDGNLICRADTTGLARGLAIDAFGDVWVGAYSDRKVYKVSGTGVSAPGADGLPRCDMYDLAPDDPGEVALHVGVSVYGLAISGSGILWTSSNPTARIDTNDMTYELVPHSGGYGVVVDGNGDAWFGTRVTRVNGVGPYLNPAAYETVTAGGGETLTAADDGSIWTTGGGRLNRIDPVTHEVTQYASPWGVSTKGVAQDDQGKIWAICQTGCALRFDPVNLVWDQFTIDPGQSNYTYSDMTGALLRQYVARQGTWTQIVDAGFTSVDWKRLDWQQVRPPGTEIVGYARFAHTRQGLDTTALVCGPFDQPPADLDACPGIDGARFAAINFLLRSAADGRKPVVGSIELSWTRP